MYNVSSDFISFFPENYRRLYEFLAIDKQIHNIDHCQLKRKIPTKKITKIFPIFVQL